MMKNYLTIFLFWCANVLMAQGSTNDEAIDISLKRNLSAKHRTELKTYQKQLDTASNRISLSAIHNNCAIVYLQASYYLEMPKLDSIFYHANHARMLTKDDTTAVAVKEYLTALGWLGVCYLELGSNKKALSYFSEILAKTDGMENAKALYKQRQMATTYTAQIYGVQGNFELAIQQYQSLFKYVKKHKIDEMSISSIVYMKLAGFYKSMDSLYIATEYANKAEKVAELNENFKRVAMANLELASIEMELEAFDEVECYLSDAFYNLKDSEYHSLLSNYFLTKSRLAANRNNNEERILFAKKAVELNAESKKSSNYVSLYKNLSAAYKNTGNFEKALVYYEEAVSVEQKLTDIEEIKRSTLLEIQRKDEKIAFEQNQKEVEAANSQRKTLVIVITLLLLVTALIASFFAFSDRQKKVRLAEIIAEKNEHLKEIDEVKSRFFTNISHELRTPLTLILSPLQHLLDIEEKKFSPQFKKTLQLIQKNTIRLKKLVNEILDLAKLESGQLKINETVIEVNTFINKITSNFDTLNSKKKDIQYTHNINLPAPFWLLLDIDKIEKIASNLLSNAFKHTKPGDEIVLTVSQKNEQLLIEVKDTGKGINDKDLPFVFNRFYQGEEDRDRLQNGTGIGLAYSKELAHLMNGDLTVKSELGQGSTFTLTLPLKIAEQETYLKKSLLPAYEDEVEITDKPLKIDEKYEILLVEDDVDMRQFVKELMGNASQVYEAQHGIEALEVLKNKNVDIIISDIMMPEMNGYELLKKLKESDKYRGIPVIMLTALNSEADKLQALTIGVDDYLTKPFLPNELTARVQNLLINRTNRKNWIDQEVNNKNEQATNSKNGKIVVSKDELVWIKEVKNKIIEELENEDFKLSQLAKDMYFSERQFQRKIKKITGLSPKQFQQEIALQKARKLLEDNQYSNSTAIAYSVGMFNVTRFSKQFETRFGKKPSAYFV